MFLLKILLNFLSLGKCLSINERNVFATFVATLMLKGGLNQVIFRFLVLFFSLFLFVHVLSNCRYTYNFQQLHIKISALSTTKSQMPIILKIIGKEES